MVPVEETAGHCVYSTVGQPSTSPEAQHTVMPVSTEKDGQSSHPCRLAAVCLWLLCMLLLTSTIVLCVLYVRVSGGPSQRCSEMVRNLEELRANHSREADIEREKKKIAFMGMLETKLSFLDHYCPILSQKRVCRPCPQDWEQFKSKCYYFSTEKNNWFDSLKECIKYGAELVIIDSKEEQEFITNHTIEGYYWIGLTDNRKKDTWLWVDGTPLKKGFWRSGEPNGRYLKGNITLNNEAHCAVTVPVENRWDDIYCYSLWNRVCETDALLL